MSLFQINSNDLSSTVDGAGGVGGLLMVHDVATNSDHYPVFDGNGNIMAFVDAVTGKISGERDYTPSGQLLRSTGTMANLIPFGFSTKYRDPKTGYIWFGFRWYDPDTGKWLSPDPIEEAGSLNLTGFVENDPINLIDALGLASLRLEFRAYIPESLGETIEGINGTWQLQPIVGGWWFKTDSGGSSRLHSFTTSSIDGSKIGKLKSLGGNIFKTEAGESTRIQATLIMVAGHGRNASTGRYKYAGEIERKTATATQSETVEDVGPCESKITVSGAAAYPFLPGPNINYTSVWDLKRKENGDINVTITGSHNTFPSYQGIVNGKVLYLYNTQGSGPGIFNLGVFFTIFKSDSLTIK